MDNNLLLEGGRRNTAREEKPLQLLSNSKLTSVIDLSNCNDWIKDRFTNGNLFQQPGQWSTLHVETPLVSFHIEYRRSDWFERKCDFQSLDAWMTNVSDTFEKTE
mmetsp:Transcript_18315/g.27128  ORF Transcript_18315/g.27128 Transcript_18315/m.27128 type:complete len:105 (+) Transcript_18315:488-802(+)|eukprot:CAMPEP_0194225248 /NCGR_PEP_ID=MMETSP0156-20130528/39190_1 /TAXON_ID=33649 /ORGANISM="Thalassionema nitzschioides, Strain L26-B" /LENGTH=104 /DNA_ID=CAMNT_0038957129 /DNA_START=474 /DNA_END=788 /DNA_ORIENTATION=-